MVIIMTTKANSMLKNVVVFLYFLTLIILRVSWNTKTMNTSSDN